MNMRGVMMVASGMVLCASAGAGSATIGASADTTLYETLDGSLANGAGEYLFVGEAGSFESRRGLVRFDVASAVPAGSTITSAVLTLSMSRTRIGDSPVSLHRVLAPWGEGASDAGDPGGAGAASAAGDATWVHRFFSGTNWAAPGGDFTAAASASITVGGVGLYTWGSTPALVADAQAWLDAPGSNFGWMLVGVEVAGTRSAKRFDSSEFVDEFLPDGGLSLRPKLVIEFTPPPSCPADANGDGRTDAADLSVLLGQFGQSVTPGTGADFNASGMVDAADLSVLLGQFGCGT